MEKLGSVVLPPEQHFSLWWGKAETSATLLM